METTPSQSPSDAELLRRYASGGDQRAFGEWVRRYVGLVYHAARRGLGGEAGAAEEVTQRVFTLAAGRAGELAAHPAPAGWLHAATRRVASETARGERRRRAREAAAFLMQQQLEDGGGRDEAWARLRPLIDEALGELDERDREAVLLRFFAALPHGAVGERLALSENAARMRVERALEKLAGALSRRGVTSTGAALGLVLAQQAGAATAAVPAGLAGSVTSAALAAEAAGAGAGGAAGWGGAVAAKAWWAGVAAVVGAGVVAVATSETESGGAAEAAAARATTATVQAQALATLAEERTREEARAEAEAARAAGGVAPGAGTGSARPAGTKRDRGTGITLEGMAPRAIAGADPQQIEAMRRRYDPFLIGQRGLTREQADRFVELKLEQARIRADLQDEVRRAGLQGGTREVEALRSRLYAPVTQGLKDLLGEEGYRAYADYEGTSAVRMGRAEPLRPAFATAGAPLTAEQEDRLVRILMVNTRQERTHPTDIGTTSRVDWAATASAAGQAGFSAAQVRVLADEGAKVRR